jgi:hypothetical protein
MHDENNPAWLRHENDRFPEWLRDDETTETTVVRGSVSILQSAVDVHEKSNHSDSDCGSHGPSWVSDAPSQKLSGVGGRRILESLPIHIEEDENKDIICCCMDAVLCYFRLFHFLCALVLMLSIIENCLAIASDKDMRDLILRIYGAVLGFLGIFIEMNVRCVVEHIKLADNWIFRGLFYIL